MLDKRYQVFVSSTYTDLSDERAEVMQALLELDCMPAGMELFPAANEEQWGWIKKIIDESDYYVVIVGGRYGTLSAETGMSYTEMEYRYALDKGMPIIAFLHQNPGAIQSSKSEGSPQAKKKLAQFRKLLEQRLCKHWTTPADLGAKVSRSITQLIKHEPAAGWVRASNLPADRTKEIVELKNQIASLQEKLQLTGLHEPEGTGGLRKGKDKLEIEFTFQTKNPKIGKNGLTYWTKGTDEDYTIETTWDLLFAYLAPELISPASEYRVTGQLNRFLESKSRAHFKREFKTRKIENIRIYSRSFDVIKIQLRALKLITIAQNGDWGLSAFGDAHMTKLLALHKSKPK